jgi:hypothetical protein
MTNLPWIKMPVSYLDNPRLGVLPEQDQARWFKLYLLAGQCDADGVITYTLEEIAFKLRISTDELQRTLDLINKADHNLYCCNGRGHEIPVWSAEQISKAEREQQRENTRRRQEEYRKRHSHVTNTVVTPLESESESESEVEVESSEEKGVKESVSHSAEARERPTDNLFKCTKAYLVKALEIPPKYNQVITDDLICPSDLLAEYIRNLGRENVEKPGTIAAMNLIKHERPAKKWYDWRLWYLELDKRLARSILVTENRALTLMYTIE